MKQTALFQRHCDLNAHMGQFASFEMPIYYTSIIEEHRWTRTQVSLFDTAHMGLIHVKATQEDLDYALTQNLSTLKIGKCRYGFILNEEAGIVDDLIVYRLADSEWMIVVNSGHTESDMESIKNILLGRDVEVTIYAGYSKLDIQGPKSAEVLKPIVGELIDELKYFNFKEIELWGSKAILSRTGYTGELGYEVYLLDGDIGRLWDELMQEDCVKAAGLGARDSLRLEKGYPLYGHELDSLHSPFDAVLDKFVDFNKDFYAKEALLRRKDSNLLLVPFVVQGRRIARAHFEVYQGDKLLGEVTSGTFAPSLEKAIGLAYLDKTLLDFEKELEIKNPRGVVIKADIAMIPFV